MSPELVDAIRHEHNATLDAAQHFTGQGPLGEASLTHWQ
jgi:hypothetical protein